MRITQANTAQPQVTMTLRMTPKLRQQIEDVARERDQPMNTIINAMLEWALLKMEEK